MEKQILTLLENEKARKQYRYLLIDNLVSLSYFHLLSMDSLQENLGKEAIQVVLRPDLAHDPRHCPKLVVIAKPDEPINKRLVHFISNQLKEEGSLPKRYLCGCIVSENAPQFLSEQLINIGLKLGQLIGVRFVPFYEPFRMFLLQEGNKICPDWLPTLLNCCSTYCFTSFTNHLQVIQSLSYTPEPFDLFVTEETKTFLKQSVQLYHLTVAWQNICENQNKNIEDSDILLLADFYNKAKIEGLEDSNDLFTLSLVLMRYKNRLDPKSLKAAIAKTIDEPGTLAQHLSQIELEQ
ncbi:MULTISPECIES: hypothetical protein [unclassified Gilliamella]|uniref:hypothetical protein n=1 Tax=unclassified Gilliamella TaxID=2685620 RepID=UPI00080DA01C|nr:hypothetical protein [Gilliamella apicola]OCG34113.1 hypothetical protein A9G32_09340 [Gilliamella apicola]OCG48046.1 hypothetical protein A9G26_10985 [Gilliamella apicola]OCG52646.1 hypothetical protein A9G27_09700 [Gilliamella apicola]